MAAAQHVDEGFGTLAQAHVPWLDDGFAGDSSVRIRFRYDDGGGQANYWFVDDVTLLGY